jgi:hypothetical protein
MRRRPNMRRPLMMRTQAMATEPTPPATMETEPAMDNSLADNPYRDL